MNRPQSFLQSLLALYGFGARPSRRRPGPVMINRSAYR